MRLITCNLGALTSKPYSFTSRSWEARREVSVDWFDPFGSNIIIELRGVEIQRVLPFIREEINGEWISDQIRFSYDSLKRQRIDRPFFLGQPIKWSTVLRLFYFWFEKKCFFYSFSGKFLTLSTGFFWKWWNLLSSRPLWSQAYDNRHHFFFQNVSLNCPLLFVGVNPRLDSPIFSLKLRKLECYQWGSHSIWNFSYKHIGNSVMVLVSFLEGNHKLTKKDPLVISSKQILENGVVWSSDVGELTRKEWNLKEKKKQGFLFPFWRKEISFWLDEDESRSSLFSIYGGHHGDRNAEEASLILPMEGPTEKSESSLNLLGYFQKWENVFGLCGLAKEGGLLLNLLFKLFSAQRGFNYFRFFFFSVFLPGKSFFLPLTKMEVEEERIFVEKMDGSRKVQKAKKRYLRFRNVVQTRPYFFSYMADSISRSSLYLNLSLAAKKKSNYQ